jgi:hypothetical protein
MIKRISFILLAITITAGVEASTLRVVFDGNGCPVRVMGDNSCPGRSGDNVACRNNGPVRWAPENMIGAIGKKSGSAELSACGSRSNQGYYQCTVSGNSGDQVSYYVESTTGCVLDPIIIIN